MERRAIAPGDRRRGRRGELASSIGVDMNRMRAEGWELPYRYRYRYELTQPNREVTS